MKRVTWCHGKCLHGTLAAKCDVGVFDVDDDDIDHEIDLLRAEGLHVLNVEEVS